MVDIYIYMYSIQLTWAPFHKVHIALRACSLHGDVIPTTLVAVESVWLQPCVCLVKHGPGLHKQFQDLVNSHAIGINIFPAKLKLGRNYHNNKSLLLRKDL